MTGFLPCRAGRAALLGFAAALFATIPLQAGAQKKGSDVLEEVIVTARKREETLLEVPVAISVLNSQLLKDALIMDQYDLFEMTPGLEYDVNFGDRNSGTPGVRGVQSLEIASTRQKAASFLDGMPMNGQTGALQFVDVERVEVYRGPQSAAFGRATFAGAINYVSKRPGEELGGYVVANLSDQERRQYQGGINGPLGDTFGFRIDANYENVRGNPDWVSTDGYDLGGVESKYASGMLTFEPTDRFDGYVKYMHLETDDDVSQRYNIIDPSCLNYNYTDQQGRPQSYLQGEYNCNSAIPAGGIQRNHDTAATVDPSSPDYALALSYAILTPAVTLERDRVQSALNFEFGESALQVQGFYSEDKAQRWWDSDNSDTAIIINMGMVGMNVNTMADPNEIQEKYAEVRWVSPSENKFRYVVGASYYDYKFLTNIFAQYAGIVLDLEDELGGPINPLQIFSEDASNIGVFFNLTYDANDKTTFSFEGRYQSDDISNFNNITGQSFNNKTTSFQPRLAVNYAVSDAVSVYGQYSVGNNPAGVNVNFTNPEAIDSINIANTGNQFGPAVITYDETTFLRFEEEKLTNVEVGVKATMMEGRMFLASALYYMEWDKMVQPYNLNWDGDWNNNGMGGTLYAPPFTMSRSFLNQGTADFYGLETEATIRVTDNFQFRGTLVLQKTKYTDFCSIWAVDTLNLPPDRLSSGGMTAFDCKLVNGNQVVRQPKVSFSLSPSYQAPIGGTGWDWSTRLDWRRSGANYLDDANLMKLPSVDTVNISAAVMNETFNIRLYGNNLLDEDVPGTIDYGADFNLNVAGNIDNLLIIPRRPREFGVRLEANF